MEEVINEEQGPPPPYNESELPLYDTIFHLPDWDLPPPPVYADAVLLGMDQPKGEVQHGVNNLGYVDFLPRCLNPATGRNQEPEFEDFRVMMTLANSWLAEHPEYKAQHCESIERKIKSGQADSEQTIQQVSGSGVNAYVRGLRLWLTSKSPAEPVQKLWYMNVLPKAIPQTVYYGRHMGYGMRGHGMSFGSYAMTVNKTTVYPDFEDLDPTIEKLNTRLKENPIPGKVLNMESIDMKFGDNYWDPKFFNPDKHPFNTDKGYWSERGSKNVLYLTVLRLFFVQGQSQPIEIGVEDFVPEMVRYVAAGKPVFEKMSELLQRANRWISQHKGVQITNVDMIESKVRKEYFSAADGGTSFSANSKCTFYSAGDNDVIFVNCIRVVYLKPGNHGLSKLSLKSFIPVRRSLNTSENMAEVLSRVNGWLYHSGAEVLCAHTQKFLFEPMAQKAIDTQKTSTVLLHGRGTYWITAVMLWIRGEYTDPPQEVFPEAPAFAQTSSGCCNII